MGLKRNRWLRLKLFTTKLMVVLNMTNSGLFGKVETCQRAANAKVFPRLLQSKRLRDQPGSRVYACLSEPKRNSLPGECKCR